MSKIKMPKFQILVVPENAILRIDEPVFGTLFIGVLNKDNAIDEDESQIHMFDYDGEPIVITLPKAWIGKRILVKYDHEVEKEREYFEMWNPKIPNSPLFYVDRKTGKVMNFFYRNAIFSFSTDEHIRIDFEI